MAMISAVSIYTSFFCVSSAFQREIVFNATKSLTQRRKDAKRLLTVVARCGCGWWVRACLCLTCAPRAERETDEQERNEACDHEPPTALARFAGSDARGCERGLA